MNVNNQYVKICSELLPIDATQVMYLFLIDLVRNDDRAPRELFKLHPLPERVAATIQVVDAWRNNQPIPIERDFYLFKLLQFISWRLGIEKKFAKGKAFRESLDLEDPWSVSLNALELLKVDPPSLKEIKLGSEML